MTGDAGSDQSGSTVGGAKVTEGMVGAWVAGGCVVGGRVVGGRVVRGRAVVCGAAVTGAAVVVGASVVGSAVVGASVVGASVVGADVVGATVVDAAIGSVVDEAPSMLTGSGSTAGSAESSWNAMMMATLANRMAINAAMKPIRAGTMAVKRCPTRSLLPSYSLPQRTFGVIHPSNLLIV